MAGTVDVTRTKSSRVSRRSLSSANETTPSPRASSAKVTFRIRTYLIMRSRYVAGRRLQPSQKGALMRYPRLAILTMLALTPVMAGAQSDQPTNDAPNPYNTVSNYFKLPEGRAGRAAGGGRAAAAGGSGGPPAGATHGNQVCKCSPDGKVLPPLGKPGGAAAPDYFYQPNDVIGAPNGDIFASEGHGAGNNR